MRAIDADELLKQQYKMGFGQMPVVSVDAIKNAPTLTPPNGWVSVEERLPTDERPVLVFVGYADTMIGFITTSSYFCFDVNPHWQWDGLVRDEQRTLFWMPLPAQPAKEDQKSPHKGHLDLPENGHRAINVPSEMERRQSTIRCLPSYWRKPR